ncbi:MAG: DegT/DnrJ/EryC1/StrS family aminotransferase [Chloroflexi bacterium]|nr:DegT/DnrJ/EryC1/StrS family aminotransferase [Chloroflexota bacterium]
MAVPWSKSAASYLAIKDEVDAAIQRVLASGVYSGGEEVEGLEREFAAFCGTRYAVALDSGSAAILLSLLAMGIGPGDEVLSVANSCYSIPAAIAHSGARTVLLDVDEESSNIDPALIGERITPRTRAIVAVHGYGIPCLIDRVMEIARRHNLQVVEDAAVSTGARYQGQRVGSFGHVGTFSLAGSKILSAFGTAGMVTTDSAEAAARVKQLSYYGKRRQTAADGISEAYGVSNMVLGMLGYNAHMDPLQAAVLRVKLPMLDGWLEARREKARLYAQALADLPVALPAVPPQTEPIYRGYLVRVPRRNQVLEHLHRRGIGAMVMHPPPIHLQPAFRYLGYSEGDFPVTERVSRQILSLPIYPELTEAQIGEVVDALREALAVA